MGGIRNYPDADNCNYFWACSKANQAYHMICAHAGAVQLSFDINKGYCDYPENVDCGDRPSNNDEEKVRPPAPIVRTTTPRPRRPAPTRAPVVRTTPRPAPRRTTEKIV